MSKGFFDKSAARYILKISITINVPERLFDYELEYGMGYPTTKSGKTHFLEIGKYVNHINHPLRILPVNMSKWDRAIQDIFSNPAIPVDVCSLEAIFINQLVTKNDVSINKKICEKNIKLPEALNQWSIFKNHILSLINSRNARNTFFQTKQAKDPLGAENDNNFCNII